MMKYRALRTLTEPERGTEQTQKQKPKQTFSFQLSFVHVISEVIGQKRLNGENLREQDFVWQKIVGNVKAGEPLQVLTVIQSLTLLTLLIKH